MKVRDAFAWLLIGLARIKVPLGAVLVLVTLYGALVHYTEPHEVAIVRNLITGRTTIDRRAGFHFTAPWVMAAKIDTRPMRVCVSSSARSFNCRLVQFNPDGWRDFLADQGLHYYWWANRFSFNSGHDEEYRGMIDVMRGYAYGGRARTFVQVLTVYPDDN